MQNVGWYSSSENNRSVLCLYKAQKLYLLVSHVIITYFLLLLFPNAYIYALFEEFCYLRSLCYAESGRKQQGLW